MIAAKQFDPVVGIDIHIIQPPGPVPPVPVPHPFVGILLDPFDFAPIVGGTVMVNGIPRATAGTGGKCIPPHIPIGGVFVKPPGNECEVFMGSSTVLADGEPLSFLGMPALSCHDIGMPPPPRIKKKKVPKSLFLPTSVVLSVPAGAPVLVGGPPTVSMMALGMRAGMAGLGKAFKKGMGAFKKVRQKVFKNMDPGFLKCKVLRAEPIDIRTGTVFVDQDDFTLLWPMPLTWRRTYRSARARVGLCGHGWDTPADARLEIDEESSILFDDGKGMVAWFPSLPENDPVRDALQGALLEITAAFLTVRLRSGLLYHFPRSFGGQREILVARVTGSSGHSLDFIRGHDGLREIRSSAGSWIAVQSTAGRIERMQLNHPDHAEPLMLVRYEYDSEGDLRNVYDASDIGYHFAYDAHRLTHHRTRSGVSFYYRYDAESRDARVTHAWGDEGLYAYSFRYDQHPQRTLIRSARGEDTTIELDDNGLPVRETDALGNVTTYEYDDAGRTIAVETSGGTRTEYQYDGAGNLVARSRPDGQLVQYERDRDGRLVALIDAMGCRWEQQWNDRGLLTARVTPNGHRTAFEYDRQGRLVSWTDPLGATTRIETDAMGWITGVIDAQGQEFRFERDARGNIRRRIHPDGNHTEVTYDPRGLPVELRNGSGQRMSLAYDPDGELVGCSTEGGRAWRFERAGLGQLRALLEPNGRRFVFEYDIDERLVRVADPEARDWQFTRDSLGRVIEETDYFGNTRTFVYNDNGVVTKVKQDDGAIEYAANPLGQVVRRVLPDGRIEEFDYDANGSLVGSRADGIAVERVLDKDRRVMRETIGHEWVQNAFDPAGRRIYRETSNGHRIQFAYDIAGRLVSMKVNDNSRIAFDRRLDGQIRAMYIDDRIAEERQYDAAGRRTRQKVHGAAGLLQERVYEYDRDGELARVSESQDSVSQYTYDRRGKLIAVERSGHSDESREAKGAGGDPTVDDRRVPARDARGRLTEVLVSNNPVQLIWDSLNRLVGSIHNGKTVNYQYDAQGRRVAKEDRTHRTEYLWDGDRVISETVDGAAGIEWVHEPAGFEPLCALARDGSVLLYHVDINGLPRELTTADRRLVWSATFDGRAAITSRGPWQIRQSLRLQGQICDEETGLYYNRNRYYDPRSGRFATPDPLGLLGGLEPLEYAPNIWRWTDPFGLALLTSGKIYRGASGTPDSLTPRPGKDMGGLSFTTDPSKFSGKVVEVDVAELSTLKADLDNPTTGHVSVFIPDEAGLQPDAAKMDEWSKTRGTGTTHAATDELLDVAKKCT